MVAATVISLLGAASALIDHSFLTGGSAGPDGPHAIVIYRTPAETESGHIPLSGRPDQFSAKAGKQNRADFDDLSLRAEGVTAALDKPQDAPRQQEKPEAPASAQDSPQAVAAPDKPQFIAAAMTPLGMGAGVSAHAAAHLPLLPQDVNRLGKADMLSLPQMVVAKLVAPATEHPDDATGTSAALFFIAPPLNNAAETTAATPATSDEAQSEGPTLAAAGIAPPHSRAGSKSTWADLVRLASVSGGDGEKIGSNIFGGLTEQQFQARELRCMATAIYFEARGEIIKGQIAVGQVIMTRVNSTFYPNTICGVVYQGQWNKNACQFSFACDGVADTPHDRKEWETALNVAKDVISGKVYLDEVGDATHYHATYVSPDWKKLVKRVTKIGVHIFYKAPFVQPIVASNDFNKL
jgi:spore germination cell wall hydrolase CwlJ-like protein